MEDYYMVLGVTLTATPELITKAYRRLALKLHPDHNTNSNATEAFQLLLRAYETLRDEIKRRNYDRIYPSINQCRSFPQKPRPAPAQTSQAEPLSDTAQIAALNKSKQERAARWQTKRKVFESSIFELQRQIRRVEQEIRNLDSISAAEAAIEAQKNSWGTWLLSPIYKKPKESEEEREIKERERQERRIEKNMKERRLDSMKTDLRGEETKLRQAKSEVDAADLSDDGKIRIIQCRIQAREMQKQREREKIERERVEEIRRQQQEEWMRRDREMTEALKKQVAAAEALRRQHAEKWASEQRQNNQANWIHIHHTQPKPRSSCRHDGWWPEVQGRTQCPECNEIWSYLLQCPSGCDMKACPRCQAGIRPRFYRGASRPVPSRARTPSPGFSYYDWD